MGKVSHHLPYHLLVVALILYAPCAVLAQVEGDSTITDGAPATRPHYHPSTAPATTAPTTAPADRLAITTWAAKGWLKNPVALAFDRQGRAYVAQTQRREGGELQTRADPLHRVIPDHTFFSLEDKLRWAGDGDPTWGQQTGGKKETIHLLEDTEGTGKVDKAKVFYEGFDKNEADILAGVLWHEGKVYATIAPDLWMLADTKGEGSADQVQSLSHGYGVHMSYSGHNMHGLTVGPDGKIYFTIADKALNVTTAEGRHLFYPYCGSCLRCNPDGSDLEVFAYGLRNVQEIAFDKYGNLFSADNDGDFPTERERLVYITEGSDSAWRYNWQYRSKSYDVAQPVADRKNRYNPWLDEKLWVPYFPGQAAYITPPLANYTDGPCGFKYATEGSLNERYRGYFFVTEFPKANVRAFSVKPKGGVFRDE
jgi:glucose/arabinose dehydrogenase